MHHQLRADAERIARSAIEAVKPDAAVRRALENASLSGNIYMVAVGKAAWQMAAAALKHLQSPIRRGIVVTKYGHSMGPLPGITCFEAGHPIPDENSFSATQAVLDMTANLTKSDTVLFLLSGGGSALFEKPLVSSETLQQITTDLLAGGASIREINTIRKRLSGVKAGRFALHCAPAKIEAVILSDVLGDPVDMIASGPAAPDPITTRQALAVAERYHITQPSVLNCLKQETPKEVPNVHTQIIGSVRELCRAAEKAARELGYEPIFLSDRLEGEAADTGRWLAQELKKRSNSGKKLALLAGGETVVHVKGTGLGGRNQELALAAAQVLDGIPNAALISLGSDGSDGPTDAAGGYADGDTVKSLGTAGLDPQTFLDNNDAYHALQAADCLIHTGPTGTNVNDITIGLIE